MFRLAVDQDFNEEILTGLRRRFEALDAVRARDIGLDRAKDPRILSWAAEEGRIVLSHDRKTMVKHGYARLAEGKPLPGVIIVLQSLDVGGAIRELELVLGASQPEELRDRVLILPL